MIKNSSIRTKNLPLELQAKVIRDVFDASGTTGAVAGFRGAARSRKLIYFMRGNTACVRPYRLPRDPQTPEQVQRREWWTRAQRHWSEITGPQRVAWNRYAVQNRKALSLRGTKADVGRNVFVKVIMVRYAMGIVSDEAPTQSPPPRLLKIIQEPASSDDAFAFRLTHNITNPTGMWIIVEQTPPTLRPTRKPRENDLRWIRGNTIESLLALQPSGALYTITNARYPVGPGQRYGMRIRVVTPEAVAGKPAAADFTR